MKNITLRHPHSGIPADTFTGVGKRPPGGAVVRPVRTTSPLLLPVQEPEQMVNTHQSILMFL